MTDPGDEHVERVLPAPASVPGITGAGDILARLEADLAAARNRLAEHRAEIDRRWEAVHAVNAEIRDIQLAIGRAGGGWDTDYYHRSRERGSTITVRDGAHSIVEDRR